MPGPMTFILIVLYSLYLFNTSRVLKDKFYYYPLLLMRILRCGEIELIIPRLHQTHLISGRILIHLSPPAFIHHGHIWLAKEPDVKRFFIVDGANPVFIIHTFNIYLIQCSKTCACVALPKPHSLPTDECLRGQKQILTLPIFGQLSSDRHLYQCLTEFWASKMQPPTERQDYQPQETCILMEAML